MGIRARKEQEKLERRESIVDAAEKVFFDKGYERTTMDDIARAAALSRGLLYVYFRDKSAILEAVMLRAAEKLRQRFREVAASDMDGGAKIQAMGQAYYAFSIEEPDHFDLLTRAAGDWPTLEPAPLDSTLDACSGEIMRIMADTLEDGIKDGSLDAALIPSPLQTALYLRGTLHGIIMLTRQPAVKELADQQSADALVEYALQMIGKSLVKNGSDV